MTDRTRSALVQEDHSEAAHSPSFTRDGSAWSEVTLLTDEVYRLRLGGLLRPAWMIGVCTGLAQAQISIQRLHARRLSHDGTWIAELHVVAMPGSADPLQLPLIKFAEEAPLERADGLCLRDYDLTPSSDHGGTLRLGLSAQDSVGLLGSLLAAFGKLALLPVEMHIETRDNEATDCLWLTTSVGGNPSADDWRALNDLLARSIQH